MLILLLFQLESWSLYALGGSKHQIFAISGLFFLILGVFIGRYFYIRSKKQKRRKTKSSLSEQELRVLYLIAEGNSNKQIADQLFIAESTVKSHASSIYTKLNVKRRTEAIKAGRELELI